MCATQIRTAIDVSFSSVLEQIRRLFSNDPTRKCVLVAVDATGDLESASAYLNSRAKVVRRRNAHASVPVLHRANATSRMGAALVQKGSTGRLAICCLVQRTATATANVTLSQANAYAQQALVELSVLRINHVNQ